MSKLIESLGRLQELLEELDEKATNYAPSYRETLVYAEGYLEGIIAYLKSEKPERIDWSTGLRFEKEDK